MRDLLTALAGALILVLVAALAVPPLIDWPAHRALVDRALRGSLGVAVRTEGRIEVRLLPSPRLRIDRLHLGEGPGREGPGRPALDARFVKAEVTLAPLLKGGIRFTEVRVGRAEIKLPATSGEALRLPADLTIPGLLDRARGRDLAVEDLQIQQFLLTTVVPATGRTDQVYAEGVRFQAPALAGPWRVEGTAGGVPFRAVSGTVGADGRVPVKISGGGDAHPRFEADARLGLAPADGGAGLLPEAEGTARLVVGPPTQAAGAYLPFSLNGSFKARGAQVRFEGVELAVDPGGKALRLAGTGRLDLRQWRAGLALEARRLDLDAFLTAPEGQGLIARGLPGPGAGLPVMLDLDLAVESATLGLDEWSGLAVTATVERAGGVLLRRLTATGPGGTALSASGQIETAPVRLTGPVSLVAPASDALGRSLRRLGLEGPVVTLLDGRRIEAAADLSAAAGSLSARNLRLALGPARLTGNARYASGEGGGRGRFEAQIRASGIDVAALPPLGPALAGLDGHDLALTLEARDVRFGSGGAGPGSAGSGSAGSGGGTIAARILSDASGLSIDSLDVADLAGADASLSGRISADGTGRVSGRLRAPVAAPLVALLERVWVAETRLVPAFLRTAPLDLAVTLDREAGAPDALRAQADGIAGGGTLALKLTSRNGRIEGGTIALSAPRAGAWFARPDIPGLQKPADLRLALDRPGGGLSVRLDGTITGLTLSTDRPVLLGSDAVPRAGLVRATSADLGPFFALAGAARLSPGPWPGEVALDLSEAGGEAQAALSGTIAGAGLSGRLARAADGGLRGSLGLDRLSLPQLAAALAMPVEPGAEPGRSSAPPAPVALDLRVATLDLGRGLVATGAAVALGLDDGALTLRDLTAGLAGGRLSGSATIARDGRAATVSGEGTLDDAALSGLSDGGAVGGRLSAALRFTARAEGAAGLAAALAGNGTVRLSDLSVPEADPAALGRALGRAIEVDEPLRDGRLRALAAEEFSRGAALARAPASAPVTIVGGVARAGPLALDLGPARWSGSLAYDLRDGRLDARGTLIGGPVPRGWAGGPPAVQFGLTGPLAAPERTLDVGALSNTLAAFVLQRELEAIELGEADQVERQRRRGRIEMDRLRAAALKAAAERAAAEKAEEAQREAQRQARLRAQQAAAEEAARQARMRPAGEGPPDATSPPAADPVPAEARP